MKILTNSLSIDWAIDYGELGYGLALSSDETFLIAGALFASSTTLGKIDTSTGNLISSYVTTGQTITYRYVLI